MDTMHSINKNKAVTSFYYVCHNESKYLNNYSSILITLKVPSVSSL